MPAPACPVCSTTDVRLVRTIEVSHGVVGSRSTDGKPVFIVASDPIEETAVERVTCANGHSHPDRVGFDVEWV